MKNVVILGSTGSIGTQALDVIGRNPSEFSVFGLAAGKNAELLKNQIVTYKPRAVFLEKGWEQDESFIGTKLLRDPDGLLELVTDSDVDLVVVAMPGLIALRPCLAAIKARKSMAIASKELLYVAGELIMRQARLSSIPVMPVDSEPSAVWQCLFGEHPEENNSVKWIHDKFAEMPINRLLITASGGPFRKLSPIELANVTPNMALNHPTWRMGIKNTIDSATMLNKGMEIVEAHWLFGLDWDKVEALVHPQSIVHAFVEFNDGSLKAQLAQPDMRLYIQYALNGMARSHKIVDRVDLTKIASLTFEPIDVRKFPCYQLAIEAARGGNSYAVVVNAADEAAVELFVDGKIRFNQISQLIKDILNAHNPYEIRTLEDIDAATLWSKSQMEQLAARMISG